VTNLSISGGLERHSFERIEKMTDVISKMEQAILSETLNPPSPSRGRRTTGKGASVALWTAQALLAGLFLFAGVIKFVTPLQEMVKQTSLPGWFLLFIGAAEVLGGIGVIIPALLRIQPVLTPIAAAGLVIIMVGATVISLPVGAMALFPFLVGALCAFVCYGRWQLKPIEPRS
jgi:uncharacterized membrane protein YphA (DoxX/SURF4 family)